VAAQRLLVSTVPRSSLWANPPSGASSRLSFCILQVSWIAPPGIQAVTPRQLSLRVPDSPRLS